MSEDKSENKSENKSEVRINEKLDIYIEFLLKEILEIFKETSTQVILTDLSNGFELIYGCACCGISLDITENFHEACHYRKYKISILNDRIIAVSPDNFEQDKYVHLDCKDLQLKFLGYCLDKLIDIKASEDKVSKE